MQIHKSYSSRHRKNSKLIDGVDITGGIDITPGININNQSPKAYIQIRNPVKNITKKLTAKDIVFYFNKQKHTKSLKKRLQSSTPRRKSRRKSRRISRRNQ